MSWDSQIKTRSGKVLEQYEKKPPVKKISLLQNFNENRKRKNPFDNIKESDKVILEGDNVFERFESLLNKTDNLSRSITIADLLALHNGKIPKTETAQKHGLDMLSQSYNKTATFYDKTPPFLNAILRDYQIAGLNWLLSLQKAGLNGILADEMGLGKTIQTISLLAHNKIVEKVELPSLVIVPLTTLLNWKAEIDRFAPDLKSFVIHGTMKERKLLCQKEFLNTNHDVYLVSYETAMILQHDFQRVHFQYVVVDEGQRIKNEFASLSVCLQKIHSNRRLLLTGTPFQNNIHELWTLLNYLAPAIFTSAEDFEEYFSEERMSKDVNVVNRLHKIINPFFLRRVKSIVEKDLKPKKDYKVFMGLTDLQKEWYKKVLQKEIDLLKKNGQKSVKNISHILMALRKVANHPYMFPAAEPSGPPFKTDETIVTSCGKMIVLDKMLEKFKKEKSRVLLFSQFTMMIDILEDYLRWKRISYCRIDGKVGLEERQKSINKYNAANSKIFIFLMSTRAGGLGINLATADVVIIYDSDWNPQMDFQAIDRAHRIGQKKEVRVFRLISKGTVDEYMVQTNEHKVRLCNIVIQNRDELLTKSKTKSEMVEMISEATRRVEAGTLESIGNVNLNELLSQSEKQQEEEKRQMLEELGKNENYLVNQKAEHAMYMYHGTNHYGLYNKKDQQELADKLRKNPKQMGIGDRALTLEEFWEYHGFYCLNSEVVNYRFYPSRYLELCKNKLEYLKGRNQILFLEKTRLKAKRASNENWTEEEAEEAAKLKSASIIDWNYGRFLTFVNNLAAVDADDYETIARLVTRDVEEVKNYSEVFWKRYRELPLRKKIESNVEKYKIRQQEVKEVNELLEKKLEGLKPPYYELKFNYSLKAWNLTDKILPEEDRFIVASVFKNGYHLVDVFESFVIRELKMSRKTSTWPISKLGSNMIKKRFDYLIEVIKNELELEKSEPPAKKAAQPKKSEAEKKK